MERLLIKHLNRNYYYLDGFIYKVSDGTRIDSVYLIFILETIFALKREEIIIITNEWFFNKFRVDSSNFWSSMDSFSMKNTHMIMGFVIMGFDSAFNEFTPRINMLARYGSNTINEECYQVVRIGD